MRFLGSVNNARQESSMCLKLRHAIDILSTFSVDSSEILS